MALAAAAGKTGVRMAGSKSGGPEIAIRIGGKVARALGQARRGRDLQQAAWVEIGRILLLLGALEAYQTEELAQIRESTARTQRSGTHMEISIAYDGLKA